MKLPKGVLGMLCALISFFAIGLPLYKQGISFPLCFLAQVGVMFLLIGVWIFLTEKRYYRAVNGKAQVRHGRLGSWEDLEEHLKDGHDIT